MTMNKIQRIVFTMACLLTSLGGYSYKIVSMGSYPVDKCTVTATYNSNNVIAGTTDIPASNSNNVTIHISNITPGYYLDRIEYEYVTDLGQAEAPRRASGPGIQTKDTIPHNSSHITHYAGDYGLAMPASDIIITAILQECISINTYSLTLDGTATSLVYNGAYHTVTLKNGETTLERGTDYTVTTGNNTYKDVFSSSITVTGCGIYKDTRTQALSITEAPLTITADNKTRDYLDENPTFTTTITGFVGDETVSALTTQPSCATTATASSPIGSYTITPSGAVAANYSFNYIDGTLTINQRNIGSTSTEGQAVISLSGTDFNTSDNYFNYNGNVQTPTVAVSYNSNPLSEGSTNDYTFVTSGCYTDASDKSKPDIYTITVMFLGNYTGTKTVTYQIRPKLQLKDDESYRWEAYYNTEAYNMKVPTGVQAWVVNGFNTTAVELTGKEVIKTQTPMLLFRAGSTKTFYPELTAETPTWTGGSYLKYRASSWDLTADPNIQDGTTKICILVRDNFVRTVSGTLAAGKCYLDLSGTTYFGAPLRLDITPTSIDTPEKTLNDLNNGKWYTLDGRQIQGVPTQKGIYIVNGKKIIIK